VVSEKKHFETFFPHKVLYRVCVFYADRKSKMATTAGHRLTLDPMGKSCSGSHLEITINIKNTKFVKDLPMIDAQFRFNQCNSFREGPYGKMFKCLLLKNYKYD
jgi:hypothetical protein